MTRWSLYVTVEGGCAPVGIKTPRQWSDQATRRSTPLLYGLSHLVTLCGRALHPVGIFLLLASRGLAHTLLPSVTCLLSSGGICRATAVRGSLDLERSEKISELSVDKKLNNFVNRCRRCFPPHPLLLMRCSCLALLVTGSL
jgi:hypothetical protein